MDYESAKRKWTKTKPIRGRNEDVRPIGDRRHTHEVIEREAIDEGLYAYHAVKYGTKCITWYPNGDIVLRTGGYATPSTANFIHMRSPFTCFKEHNKVWVQVRVSGEHPSDAIKTLPVGSELRLNSVGRDIYKPATPVMIKKHLIDRTKMKDARAHVQPFLSWAKAFLRMSDGWVMHETRKQVLGWERRHNSSMYMPMSTRNDHDLYKMLVEQAEIVPEDIYLRVLCCLAGVIYVERRVAETYSFDRQWGERVETFTQVYEDYQVQYDMISRKVNAWLKRFEDVHRMVEVEPGKRAMRGAI